MVSLYLAGSIIYFGMAACVCVTRSPQRFGRCGGAARRQEVRSTRKSAVASALVFSLRLPLFLAPHFSTAAPRIPASPPSWARFSPSAARCSMLGLTCKRKLLHMTAGSRSKQLPLAALVSTASSKSSPACSANSRFQALEIILRDLAPTDFRRVAWLNLDRFSTVWGPCPTAARPCPARRGEVPSRYFGLPSPACARLLGQRIARAHTALDADGARLCSAPIAGDGWRI